MFGGVPRRAWCCVVQQKVQFRLQFGDRANPSPSERVSLLFASTMMAMSIPWLSLCLASVLQSMWLGYFCNPSDHCETLTWLARWILYWFVRFDEFVWICRRAQPMHSAEPETEIYIHSHIWPPPVAIFLALRVWEGTGAIQDDKYLN